jgi:hypothetical protein
MLLLRHKYPNIIETVSEKTGIPIRQAMDMFYQSEVYLDVVNGVSDMHCRSDEYLAEELRREFDLATG